MVLDATSISRKSHGRPMIICWPDNLLDQVALIPRLYSFSTAEL